MTKKNVLSLVATIVISAISLFAQSNQNSATGPRKDLVLTEQTLAPNDRQYRRWFSSSDWSCQVYERRDGTIFTLTHVEYPRRMYSESMNIRRLASNGLFLPEGRIDTLTLDHENQWALDLSLSDRSNTASGTMFHTRCANAANRDLPSDIKDKFHGFLGVK